MTIISALRSATSTLIGYNDGAELGGSPISGTSTPWIFFGKWALGITGESSVQRLLAYKLNGYKEDNEKADESYIINHIADILVEYEIGSKNDTEYVRTFGIYGILAHDNGSIWDVSGCLSLTKIPTGTLWAQGSGADYSLGADYAITKLNSDIDDERRMMLCIEAAIDHDIHCVGRAVVKSVEFGKSRETIPD